MPATKKQAPSKKASKKAGKSSGSSKRTLLAPHGDKRYIRRDAKGRIKESDDQGASLSQDVKKRAKTVAKPGHGDEGDQPQKKSKATKQAAGTKQAAKKGRGA